MSPTACARSLRSSAAPATSTPSCPSARALVAAGHEVAIAGSGNQMPRVEAAGFAALATSSQRPRQEQSRARTPLEPIVAHDTEVEFAENFADKGARCHVFAVGEHISPWQPDVVLREETDFGAVLAAELAGVLCATLPFLAAATLARAELVRSKIRVPTARGRPAVRSRHRHLRARPGALAVPTIVP